MISPGLLAAAEEHLAACRLCEHRCGANRLADERGPCQTGPEARVYRHRIEFSEERELLPCHLFYLSGCDLRCRFCIAEEAAFNPRLGQVLTPEFFAKAVAWGQQRGARTLQWVGGEPTVHLPAVLKTVAACSHLPPMVWKSDFYGTPAAFELLAPVIATYVADFKFGNNACARRLASVDRYVEVVTRNLRDAATRGRLIVRHLLLPDHEECCFRPVVRWLAEHLPHVPLNVRDGYWPHWRAVRDPQLGRILTADEIGRAREWLATQGVTQIS